MPFKAAILLTPHFSPLISELWPYLYSVVSSGVAVPTYIIREVVEEPALVTPVICQDC
jgi:hypothetical protein